MKLLSVLGHTARKTATKKLVLKTVFGSREQKRTVMRAAKESAADQRALMHKYRESIKR